MKQYTIIYSYDGNVRYVDLDANSIEDARSRFRRAYQNVIQILDIYSR